MAFLEEMEAQAPWTKSAFFNEMIAHHPDAAVEIACKLLPKYFKVNPKYAYCIRSSDLLLTGFRASDLVAANRHEMSGAQIVQHSTCDAYDKST